MKKILTGLLFAIISIVTHGQTIHVKEAWTRATVKAQDTAGVFMTIESSRQAKLIGAETTLSQKTELHQMRMQDGVMIMRPVASILLPANTAIALKPGGLHIMLLGLKKPLTAGEVIPITLTFEWANKQQKQVWVEATVLAPGATGHQH